MHDMYKGQNAKDNGEDGDQDDHGAVLVARVLGDLEGVPVARVEDHHEQQACVNKMTANGAK